MGFTNRVNPLRLVGRNDPLIKTVALSLRFVLLKVSDAKQSIHSSPRLLTYF
jgi:hypothetical protein